MNSIDQYAELVGAVIHQAILDFKMQPRKFNKFVYTSDMNWKNDAKEFLLTRRIHDFLYTYGADDISVSYLRRKLFEDKYIHFLHHENYGKDEKEAKERRIHGLLKED